MEEQKQISFEEIVVLHTPSFHWNCILKIVFVEIKFLSLRTILLMIVHAPFCNLQFLPF